MDIKHVYVFMNMFNKVYWTYWEYISPRFKESGGMSASDMLGKLSIKEEPGKVRVFAMVDYITQVIMSPLHNFFFKMLKSIPQDGTFDQGAPVERLIRRLDELYSKVNPPVKGTKKRKFDGYLLTNRKKAQGIIWAHSKIGRSYSFDLSAATDRLPINYQALIVQQLHPKLGVTWKELLTGRDYYTTSRMQEFQPDLPAKVRYAVGQPMGALSSWAMLAITHHALVQWAAFRVGQKGWFEYYAILGDDVVIANDKVAFEYLRIMRALGVEISLAKTLLGRDRSMEFAKRFFLRGEDVSPLSTLEFLAGQSNIPTLVTFVAKARRLVDIRLADVAKALKFGYRVVGSLDGELDRLGSRARGLVLLLLRPGQPGGAASVMDWLLLRSASAVREVTEEQKGRMVMSLEATVFTAFEQQIESLVKKTLHPPLFRHPKTGRMVEDPNRISGLFGLPTTLDHNMLAHCRDLVETHINLPIVTEVLDRLDHVREDVRSQIAYYRTRVKVIPKTPSERLDMILEIMKLLEERIASVPMVKSLWTKSGEAAVSSSRSLRLWNQVRRVINRTCPAGELRTSLLGKDIDPQDR